MASLTWNKVGKHPTVLVKLDEEEQEHYFTRLAQEIGQRNIKTTVVCLNHTYEMILEDFRNAELDTKNFAFVDVLSAEHSRIPANRVLHVEGPTNLEYLIETIREACTAHECEAIMIDSLSSLLSFQDRHNVLFFANELKKMLSDNISKKLIFFAVTRDSFPEEEGTKLPIDLEMFVDYTVALAKD